MKNQFTTWFTKGWKVTMQTKFHKQMDKQIHIGEKATLF